MVSQNTTLVSSLGLRIGPACEAGLSAGMRRERVTTNKKGKKKEDAILIKNLYLSKGYGARTLLSELSDKLVRFHVKLTLCQFHVKSHFSLKCAQNNYLPESPAQMLSNDVVLKFQVTRSKVKVTVKAYLFTVAL